MAQTPGAAGPIIELRVARTSSAPGFTQRGSVADTTFFVNDTALVSDSDIIEAHANRIENLTPMVAIAVTLKPQADDRVATATKRHVGDRLAIFLDHEFVGAPPIVSAIGGAGPLHISAGPPAALDRIVAAVAARWPDHH